MYVGRLYECTDGACTRHVFAGDKRIASLHADGTARYYHADHLDSTRVVTDEAGAPGESTVYRASGDAPAGDTKYRYTSKELDVETGLYFYGARYYNALLGRFISPDPVPPSAGDPQTLNRYAYARNNPIFFHDPSGYAEDEALGMSYVSAEEAAAAAAKDGPTCRKGLACVQPAGLIRKPDYEIPKPSLLDKVRTAGSAGEWVTNFFRGEGEHEFKYGPDTPCSPAASGPDRWPGSPRAGPPPSTR